MTRKQILEVEWVLADNSLPITRRLVEVLRGVVLVAAIESR
ncbi:MAG: hypothetical protein ABR555_09280 [Pyrinomonadaceae bacterium]